MSVEKAKVLNLVVESINELNEMREDDEQIEASATASLYGEGSSLDSLALVNLIVIAEEKIEDTFEVSLTLADEKAMSLRISPFRSVETLSDYIAERIAEVA